MTQTVHVMRRAARCSSERLPLGTFGKCLFAGYCWKHDLSDSILINGQDDGHADVVHLLLEARANLNSVAEDGSTALLCASEACPRVEREPDKPKDHNIGA